MYVKLKITADYGDRQTFIAKLKDEIGANAIDATTAVANTIFAPDAERVIPMVVAAEQIQHQTVVLYFVEGRDTIAVHIAARKVADLKQQAVRITRRIRALFEKPSVKTKTKAVIYVVEGFGWDVAIISGSHVSLARQFVDAFAERWLTRLLTPLLIFLAAGMFLTGSNFYESALISFVATVVTLLIESTVFVVKTDDWKWTEGSNDE